MSYKQKLAGLKRTRWDNKTTNQKQKILKSHYELLGYVIPKYLDSKKLTEKQLSQALSKITRGYTSRATPKVGKYNPQINYENTVKKFNKTIEGLDTKLLQKGFSQLEINYLKGEELFLPQLRKKSFHSDMIDLQKIKNQQFQTKKDMVEETKRLKEKIKEINKKIKDGNFYDELNANRSFNDMLSNSAFTDFSDSDIQYLKEHFNALTPFQKELFMKVRFSELRDKYKYLFEEGNEDKASEELYNAILFGIRNTHRAVTGEDLLISKSGKRY